jgi:hypothetical protein
MACSVEHAAAQQVTINSLIAQFSSIYNLYRSKRGLLPATNKYTQLCTSKRSHHQPIDVYVLSSYYVYTTLITVQFDSDMLLCYYHNMHYRSM